MMATPASGKQSGLVCGGVQLHLTAPDTFDGLRTGLHLVQALAERPGVGWREETDLLPSGGGPAETVPWIDRLTGTASVRRSLAAGLPPEAIAAGWSDGLAAFRERAEPHRLYAPHPESSAGGPPRSGGEGIPVRVDTSLST
ncbi:exo-beta-N-acetylmuramidase NamZ domain-containing protein [Leifsonia xyli]|nr:exo-beta-N-acetylmuramidase NamZ domain-containing protein [Leifsonia xyli]